MQDSRLFKLAFEIEAIKEQLAVAPNQQSRTALLAKMRKYIRKLDELTREEVNELAHPSKD